MFCQEKRFLNDKLTNSFFASKALVTSSDALVPSSFLLLLVRHLLLAKVCSGRMRILQRCDSHGRFS